jgi:hypothetical protein
MKKTFTVAKGIISFVILAFIVMVIWGVYTALDAATAGYTATDSVVPSSEIKQSTLLGGDTGESSVSSDPSQDKNESGSETEQAEVNTTSTSTQQSSSSSGATSPSNTAGANNTSQSNSSGSANAANNSGGAASVPTPDVGNPPKETAPSVPAKTWHPAWDEWVEAGYWEEKHMPATYGQRDVFGSVCNECGASIGGRAMAHLKETHHSGYHEGVVGSETYEITPARTEKVWVDTSYWVHHEGYWD